MNYTACEQTVSYKGCIKLRSDPDLPGLLKEFWRANRSRRRSMCRRDNCGPTASMFIWFLGDRKILAHRERGIFTSDKPVHEFWDFTNIQHVDMVASGLNPKDNEDRFRYMMAQGLEQEHRRIPHYWVVVGSEIIDPVGQNQFIASGLATDLGNSRYEPDFLNHRNEINTPKLF